ncbi:hypothetical protein PR202_gb22106 [Eleusine coracana subsp. coracana]|uniref:Uncharacterized protein n=1 Tax=Eleusine coracana subsp. coracana TaxID=191504 RepID=A0AAV5FET8_ELECO|nr:hypothetical protein PR202_gb22106 [Eleusine coracana subsp. coracana]
MIPTNAANDLQRGIGSRAGYSLTPSDSLSVPPSLGTRPEETSAEETLDARLQPELRRLRHRPRLRGCERRRHGWRPTCAGWQPLGCLSPSGSLSESRRRGRVRDGAAGAPEKEKE